MTTDGLMNLILILTFFGSIVAYVGIVRAKRFRNPDGSIRRFSYAWWTIVLCTPFGLGLVWAFLRPLRLQRRRAAK